MANSQSDTKGVEGDGTSASHYHRSKSEQPSEQEIIDNPLPSDGVAGERLEEPSWKPHPVLAQFPEDLRAIRLTEPETYAAGMPAVVRSMEHLGLNKSFFRGSRTLLALNHSHGVDCMSCAWPEGR